MMKQLKKLMVMIVCVGALSGLTACGSNDDAKDNGAVNNEATDIGTGTNGDNMNGATNGTKDNGNANGSDTVGGALEDGADDVGDAVRDGVDDIEDGLDDNDTNNTNRDMDKNTSR